MTLEIEVKELERIYRKWGGEFMNQPIEPMGSGLSEVFILASMSEQVPEFPGPDIEGTFQYRLVDARFAFVGVEATKSVKTLVVSMVNTPRSAVMYVHALAVLQAGKNKLLDMNVLAHAFPRGYLKEECLSKMWDKQKLSSGKNMLDVCDASILRMGNP